MSIDSDGLNFICFDSISAKNMPFDGSVAKPVFTHIFGDVITLLSCARSQNKT